MILDYPGYNLYYTLLAQDTSTTPSPHPYHLNEVVSIAHPLILKSKYKYLYEKDTDTAAPVTVDSISKSSSLSYPFSAIIITQSPRNQNHSLHPHPVPFTLFKQIHHTESTVNNSTTDPKYTVVTNSLVLESRSSSHYHILHI